MSETEGKDLVERLREWTLDGPAGRALVAELAEAADEIERLRKGRWRPAWAVHPGEILREELVERGLSQAAFADSLGCSYQHMSRVCCGHVRIEPPFAVRLEEALDVSAELWLNLQQAHDLHQVRTAV